MIAKADASGVSAYCLNRQSDKFSNFTSGGSRCEAWVDGPYGAVDDPAGDPYVIEHIDRYVPDYKSKCCNCGQTPVVTGVKDGKVVYQGEMCGPCTFGEAECIDPTNW
jgi:hypothetical protein